MIDKLKADVTKKDNNNNAVLFPAANNCPGKVVEFIIEQYIKIFELENFINHKNNDGMDALDIALNSGNEKAIEVLRSYGADIKNKVDAVWSRRVMVYYHHHLRSHYGTDITWVRQNNTDDS